MISNLSARVQSPHRPRGLSSVPYQIISQKVIPLYAVLLSRGFVCLGLQMQEHMPSRPLVCNFWSLNCRIG